MNQGVFELITQLKSKNEIMTEIATSALCQSTACNVPARANKICICQDSLNNDNQIRLLVKTILSNLKIIVWKVSYLDLGSLITGKF